MEVFESAQIWQEFTARMKAHKPCLKAKSQNPDLTNMALNLISWIIFTDSDDNGVSSSLIVHSQYILFDLFKFLNFGENQIFEGLFSQRW